MRSPVAAQEARTIRASRYHRKAMNPARMTATPSTRAWRWTAALFLACIALTVLLWALRAWVWLGVAPVNAERTPFSDTLAHLATAVNCGNGLGTWYGRVCFVPDIETVPRAPTYEPWLLLYRLGVDSLWHVQAAAVLIIGLFYLAVALSFRPRGPAEAMLVLALLLTAGVQMGVERGNFDLLIAALLCLAGGLLGQGRAGAGLLGAATLSLASMLKLYTGLACASAWLVSRAPSRWLLPASLAALALAIAVVGPRELLILADGAPEGGTRFSTGARWLFLQAGTGWGMAAMAAAVSVTAAAGWRLRRVPTPAFSRWPRRSALFQLAFLTAVPLFLFKDSYDYRLVLWLPCLALPLAMLRWHRLPTPWRRLSIALLALFAFVSGIELPATWLDRLGHATAGDWPARLALALVYGKQFAAWILAGLLGLVSLHILRQRVAAPQDRKN